MNTKIIQLLEEETEGVGILRSFGGVKKTGGDSTGVQIDVNLYFAVRTSSESKEVDPMIKGASSQFADRDSRDDDDPAKSDYKVVRKFHDDKRKLTLTLAEQGQDGGGKVLVSDLDVSVIQCVFSTSKKAASFVTKIRIYGLRNSQVGQLCEGLQEHVGITLAADTAQIGLFNGGQGAQVVALDDHRKRTLPKVGQLALGSYPEDQGGAPFSGLVKEVYEEGGVSYALLTQLDGKDGKLGQSSEIEVSTDWVVSAINVVPPRGKTLETILEDYIKKAIKAGTPPTVAAIVQALGEEHSQDLTPTESWALTAKLMTRAAKIDVFAPQAAEA